MILFTQKCKYDRKNYSLCLVRVVKNIQNLLTKVYHESSWAFLTTFPIILTLNSVTGPTHFNEAWE